MAWALAPRLYSNDDGGISYTTSIIIIVVIILLVKICCIIALVYWRNKSELSVEPKGVIAMMIWFVHLQVVGRPKSIYLLTLF